MSICRDLYLIVFYLCWRLVALQNEPLNRPQQPRHCVAHLTGFPTQKQSFGCDRKYKESIVNVTRQKMPSRNHLDKIGRKKKKKWTEEAMERALIEVKSGRCTVRRAAKEFGVPKSSLGDRVSGRRVILPKSATLGCKPTSGLRDHISILACFSATGEDIPPFIIYSKAYPGGVCYKTQGPPNALYGWSDSGCVNSDLFKKWFLKHFLLHTPKERPLLLIFDGHKSPIHLEVVEAARKEDVILLCLPPHCSHILQPLDAGLFVLLKQHFAALLGDGCATDTHYAVSKKEFSSVFKETYQLVKEEEGVRIVKEGFRKCGIYPLNHFTINDGHLMPLHSMGPAAGPSLSTSVQGVHAVGDVIAAGPSS
ncbi:hypothetical protein FQN60_000942 [Etheostoma spectabile]|uniref:HTH psq-type domain-containing protein n=1 Tax=Etheostoma spectabile TaxID=54343 RepID=A0A5J5D325_9PERO|nr:hypothetical protein FQN60_000942 [Etheostoma spectabile]